MIGCAWRWLVRARARVALKYSAVTRSDQSEKLEEPLSPLEVVE